MKLREGVTKAEVRVLCDLLRKIGDPAALRTIPRISEKRGRETWSVAQPERAKTDEEIARSYDDEYGDPVWYVP